MSRRKVALDTNVFLLFLVGLADRAAIARHKRLAADDAGSYDTPCRLPASYDEIVVTPGCLAETTNLLDSDKGSRSRCYQILRELIESGEALSEKHVPAVKVVEAQPFLWLGFTDASYVELAEEGIPVITADFKLYQQVVARNEESVNFTTVAFDFAGWAARAKRRPAGHGRTGGPLARDCDEVERPSRCDGLGDLTNYPVPFVRSSRCS